MSHGRFRVARTVARDEGVLRLAQVRPALARQRGLVPQSVTRRDRLVLVAALRHLVLDAARDEGFFAFAGSRVHWHFNAWASFNSTAYRVAGRPPARQLPGRSETARAAPTPKTAPGQSPPGARAGCGTPARAPSGHPE